MLSNKLGGCWWKISLGGSEQALGIYKLVKC